MIRIFGTLQELSDAVADRFVELSRLSVEARGRFLVALAGGSTPRRAYERLSEPPRCNTVSWSKTHFFWGDERCVPPDDERSNLRMAREVLLDRVPVPAENLHPIDGTGDPRESAPRYEKTLRRFFGKGLPRFDLVLLGLGTNAHTASLFPGVDALDARELGDPWVAAVHPPGEVGRVTLTAPALNHAARTIFLVSGAVKAQALHDVLEGASNPRDFPAQIIRPVDGELDWYVDADAAALLSAQVRGG